MDINTFDNKVCNIIKHIPLENGIYGYYNARLQDNIILKDIDIKLINYCIDNIDKNSKILDVAGGIGQISIFLALNGFINITMVECDIKRYEVAININKQLNSNCKMIKSKYQDIKLDNYEYIFFIGCDSRYIGSLKYLPMIEELLNKNIKIIIEERYMGITIEKAIELNCYNSKFIKDYLEYETEFTDKLKINYKWNKIANISNDNRGDLLMFSK